MPVRAPSTPPREPRSQSHALTTSGPTFLTGRNGGAKRRKSSFAIDELRSNESPYEASKNSKQAAASTVFGKRAPLPTRNARHELIFADHKEFRPNKSPQEVRENALAPPLLWQVAPDPTAPRV